MESSGDFRMHTEDSGRDRAIRFVEAVSNIKKDTKIHFAIGVAEDTYEPAIGIKIDNENEDFFPFTVEEARMIIDSFNFAFRSVGMKNKENREMVIDLMVAIEETVEKSIENAEKVIEKRSKNLN